MASKEAEALLKLAREQLARAEEDPDDAENVFVWSFWGLENTIMAAAAHAGIMSIKQHWAKGEAARRLAGQFGLTDVSALLRDLNDGRKSAAYGDTEAPDIAPGDVLIQFRGYVEEVAEFLKKPSRKKRSK